MGLKLIDIQKQLNDKIEDIGKLVESQGLKYTEDESKYVQEVQDIFTDVECINKQEKINKIKVEDEVITSFLEKRDKIQLLENTDVDKDFIKKIKLQSKEINYLEAMDVDINMTELRVLSLIM